MRARNIKPGFYKNDILGALPPLDRILFSGLWCLADREGRLEDRPARIRAEVLPFDDCEVDEMLDELADAGFIHRYERKGIACIQIVNFVRHQNPSGREAESVLPAEAAGKKSPSKRKKTAETDGIGENVSTEPSGELEETGNRQMKITAEAVTSPCQGTDLSVSRQPPIPYTDNPHTDNPHTDNPHTDTPHTETADASASAEEKVLTRLEKASEKTYRDRNPQKRIIRQALSRGFSEDDLIRIAEGMSAEWKGTRYARALTPSTLFGDRLEDYLNRVAMPSGPGRRFNAGTGGNYSDEDLKKVLANAQLHINGEEKT